MPSAAPSAASREANGYAADGKGTDALLGQGPLIVRSGQLDLEVAVLDDALAAADKAVTAAGGYVAASQRQGDDDRASASVTYRIPVARWEETLAALRAVGAKVLSEQTGRQEVTSQVVDLGARLANLRATEAALQAIMARATKIPDVLEVQSQLTGVRQEIEQLTAQKQSLEEQAAMATLRRFSLPRGWPSPVREAGTRSGIDRAAATLVGLGQGSQRRIWVAIVLLPLALVWGRSWACLAGRPPRAAPDGAARPARPPAPA